MKRLALFLLVMTMTGAGVSYAETNNPIQNFFLGDQQLSGTGFNQVLSLLIGPEGQPGPAGVAGRDGAAGLNGADGAPGPQGPQGVAGATGAQGPQGLPGQSPVTVQLAVGSTNCPNGGTQITDGTGVITYVCNGSRGAAGPSGPEGATGATGATGPAGSGGSGGANINGSGQISLGACDTDLTVSFSSIFVADGFVLRQINMKDLAQDCNGRKISVFFPIKVQAPNVGGNPTPPYGYASGASRNFVDCVMQANLSSLSGSNNEIILRTSSPEVVAGSVPAGKIFPMTCTLRSNPSVVIDFDELYTADVDTNIGFQIGS
jgi:hypothetical protein